MKASYILINEKGSWIMQPSQTSWDSKLLCWGFQFERVVHNHSSPLYKVSRKDFPGTSKDNKEQLVLLNLQTKINTVHKAAWLLTYLWLPPQAVPCTRSNVAAGTSTCFTVPHTFVTVLTPKGEISDCFRIFRVVSVVYFFSNFKHKICKKNMNQKMHGIMFK